MKQTEATGRTSSIREAGTTAGRQSGGGREREQSSKLWRLWPKLCPLSQVHHFLFFLPVVLHRRIPCFASHGLRLPAAAARIPCSLTPSPCHPPPPPPRRSFVVKSQSDGGQYISLSPSLYPLLLTWDFAFGIPSSLQALSVTVLWIYDLKFYWWTYILYEYVRGKEKTKAL